MAKKAKKDFKFFTKGSSDYSIWIVVVLLVALGLIMVLSASSATALSESGNSYKYFYKQALCAGIGFVGMIVLSKLDYRIYRKLKWVIYAVVVVLLFSVEFVGISAGGAKRWIRIGGFNFQPSEVAKLGLIIFYASFLADVIEKGKIKSIWSGYIFPLAFLLPVAYAIFVRQNHFSATLVIGIITMVQIIVAGTRLGYVFITGVAGVAGLVTYLGAGSGGFRLTRVQTWLDPWSDVTGDGWQIIQSLYAIGSGGIFGAGLGQSKQKYLYLPEPQNDFIFAVLAEELGYVGCLAVIILFIIFIWRGILIAMRAKDNFGSLIAVGIVTMIGIQALINIAVVTNTMPVTGMELPFFSYGGTAMIVDLCAVGVLLNISRKE
jgi:cell division protein FtsW